MSRLDYSKALFGKRETKASTSSTPQISRPSTQTRFGVVSSYDASSGIATVTLDGSVDNSGNPVSISITSDVPLSEGQRITVIVSGTDITVIPDETSIGSVADVAASSAVASAVGQYFWHDTQGVHVSQAKPIVASTRNILLNAYGMALYKGDPALSTGVNKGIELASFTDTQIELGKNCSTPAAGSPTGSVGITMLNQFALAAKYVSFTSPSGATFGVGLDIDAPVTQLRNVSLDYLSAEYDVQARTGQFYDKYGNSSIRGAAACLTNSAALDTTAGTLTRLTLGNSIVSTNANLFSKGTGSYASGIKCLYAAPGTTVGGNVTVSAQVYAEGLGSSNNLVIAIYQNSTKIAEVGVSTSNSTGMATATISPRMVSVNQNDYFYLYAKTTTAVTGAIPAGAACLHVMYN